jgi:hypothetical protein
MSPSVTVDEARIRILYRDEEFLDHFMKTLGKGKG